MQTKPNTLLLGLVGSTGYGLNHENSDKDYCGVYAVPTQNLLGLDLPDLEKAEEFKNPDTKYYEALHFCKLALKSNPSILEMLWLSDYEEMSADGRLLVGIRHAFPSRKLVKAAYLGYANDQYTKLLKDPRREKRAKNARHFARLLYQGAKLYETGHLKVRLATAERFIWFGETVADGNLDLAKTEMANAEKIFDGPSVLPEQPNRALVNNWLLRVRHGFL
jgi:uncharacterized protein